MKHTCSSSKEVLKSIIFVVTTFVFSVWVKTVLLPDKVLSPVGRVAQHNAWVEDRVSKRGWGQHGVDGLIFVVDYDDIRRELNSTN